MSTIAAFLLFYPVISSVVVFRLLPVAARPSSSSPPSFSDVGLMAALVDDPGSRLSLYPVVDRHVLESAGTLQGRCEPIGVPMCSALRYNATRMPNLVGHVNQRDAAEHVNVFVPLIQTGCSRLLKFFLCSIYTPMCTEQVDEVLVIAPCRSLCLTVRAGCEPVLARFNLDWPDVLDCSSLPDPFTDRQNLCIDIPSSAAASAMETDYERVAPPSGHSSSDTSNGQTDTDADKARREDDDGQVPGSVAQNDDWSRLLASLRHQHVTSNTQIVPLQMNGANRPNRKQPIPGHPDRSSTPSPSCNTITNLGYHDNGSLLCNMAAVTPTCSSEILYRSADKRFAEVWMTVWAAVCFASTTIALLTFLLDTSRVRTPERPIVYISLCYCIYSASLLFRAGIGAAAISCHRSSSVTGHLDQRQSGTADNVDDENFRLTDGLDGAWCTATFVVGYYFSTAAGFWWMALGLGWYLVASRKWCVDSVERRLGGYVHAVAWSFPAVLTMISVVQRRVGIDELTSTCVVTDIDWDTATYRQQQLVFASLMDRNEPEIGIPPATSSSPPTVTVLTFVFVPLIASLVLGIGLLSTGLISTVKIGRDLASQMQLTDGDIERLRPTEVAVDATSTMNTRSRQSGDSLVVVVIAGLERLIVRVTVFGLLYSVPQVAVIAVLVYELAAGPQWQAVGDKRLRAAMNSCASLLTESKSTLAGQTVGVESKSCLRFAPLDASIPTIEVMLLKIFLQTAVGIASIAWSCSSGAGGLWIRKITAITRHICTLSPRTRDTDAGGKRCRRRREVSPSEETIGWRRGISWYVDDTDARSSDTMRSQRLQRQRQRQRQHPKEPLICVATWGLQRQCVGNNKLTVTHV